MNKRILLIILTVLVAGFGYLFYQNIYQKHIIFLKGNMEIVADEAWIVGEQLFYEIDNDVKSIAMPNVLYVKQADSFDLESSVILTKRLLTSYQKKGSDILSDPTIKTVNIKKWFFLSGATLLVVMGGMVVFSKLKNRAQSPRPEKPPQPAQQPIPIKPAKPKKKKKKVTKAKRRPKKEKIEYQGQEAIVQFFLEIFMLQKGVTEEDEAEFQPVDKQTHDGNDIYELRVKLEDDWESRRMTIGPIGEESGSRSTCYYVIFDDHLVIKIPPTPLTKFNKYIHSIKRDGTIAELLQPRECLIPRVSVILKKVHPFYDVQDLSIEQLEERYIDWLKENDEYQAFLKIGDTFAYFMDLSRYFFLGNILNQMHDVSAKIVEEIFKQPDILWNPVEFEARYGQQNVIISDNLQPVYTSFENRAKNVLQHIHIYDEISFFQIKEWFLTYLSGGVLSASDIDMKPGVASNLNAAAKKLLLENGAPIDRYRQMIRSYAVNKSLQQHKAQMSGLITNLLELMTWLDEKKISMRDLKPDNLIVAGDPSKFPQFLESAALYAIGLIDVETAVSYDVQDIKQMKQPPLGGTPSFSTPSHVMKNELLANIYQDLSLILHLQDWYAAIGMIYTVVTGERLFDRTSKVLLNLKAGIKDQQKKKGKPVEIIAEASRKFWSEASKEFEIKIQENMNRLNYISAIVTKESKLQLIRLISDTHESLLKTMQQVIDSQDIFKSDKIRKSLKAAPHLKVQQFKMKFMKEQAKTLPPEERQTAIKTLNVLIYLKKQSAQLMSAAGAMEKSVPIITAHDLLNTIFIMVLINMHQSNWGPVINSQK
jgi:hypothetical protein